MTFDLTYDHIKYVMVCGEYFPRKVCILYDNFDIRNHDFPPFGSMVVHDRSRSIPYVTFLFHKEATFFMLICHDIPYKKL